MRHAILPSALLVAALLLAPPATATTWAPASRPDPLADGATCDVHEPMSYGSYIYHWPSKYDQVFWPLTDAHGLWYCPTSGFTSFMGDFDDVTDAEKPRLRDWLAANRGDAAAEPSLAEKLRLLEGLSGVRDGDAAKRTTVLRVLAYLHDEQGDFDAAARYRREALVQVRTALAGELETERRLEYLFVAAAYSREAGDAAAAAGDEVALLSALDAAVAAAPDDENVAGYVDYLRELVPDLALIAPGGPLAPDPASDDDEGDAGEGDPHAH